MAEQACAHSNKIFISHACRTRAPHTEHTTKHPNTQSCRMANTHASTPVNVHCGYRAAAPCRGRHIPLGPSQSTTKVFKPSTETPHTWVQRRGVGVCGFAQVWWCRVGVGVSVGCGCGCVGVSARGCVGWGGGGGGVCVWGGGGGDVSEPSRVCCVRGCEGLGVGCNWCVHVFNATCRAGGARHTQAGTGRTSTRRLRPPHRQGCPGRHHCPAHEPQVARIT